MADIKQSVRFDFFVPYSEDDEGNEFFVDLTDLLNDIHNLKGNDRIGHYFGTPVRMDSIHVMPQNPDITYFHMVRMRDEGLASTKQDTEKMTDIVLDSDDYIAEDISGFFDAKTCAVMLQRNSHSLSISGVREYLKQKYEEKHTNDNLLLSFRPVPDLDIIKKVKKVTNFRRLQLKFASSQVTNFDQGFSKVLGQFSELFSKAGGSQMDLLLSSSRGEPDLKREEMLSLISEIQNNQTILSSAVFAGKEGDAPIELYDLLNGKLQTYSKFSISKIVEGQQKKYHLNQEAVEEEMYRIYVTIDKYQDKVIKNLKWNM
ncbi:hypothetical protein LACPH_001782 [Lacticaseibacillus parahuelsenbergensis]|uniref:Uncharacterized protein n=1 Tax=Lacticaseibacillus parahuelsenbergensis TaxID=3068305 RepID=A0ABY9L0C4_9LACO|nr:DUF6731 family protein [Lacticaseibacillus sp. NCIMB 15471]WLV77063.1 hypothetical protein LACPH_001782 [Lacticaseibacillus sp. NCIMB 15471]